MPKVRKNESEKDFVKRCIPFVMDEGKKQDQATAICYSLYKNKQESYNMTTFKSYLNEGVVTTVLAYKFTTMIATPFDKWKAYKSGMIDIKGKKLRKAKTQEEKNQTGAFWNIARKIKILFNKFVPNKKYLALLLAMYLMKKESIDSYESVVKEQLDKNLTNVEQTMLINILNEISKSTSGFVEQEKFFVGKDLTKEEARKLGLKKIKKDHRGINYNSKTGFIIFI